MCPDPCRHDACSYYREFSMALAKSFRKRLRRVTASSATRRLRTNLFDEQTRGVHKVAYETLAPVPDVLVLDRDCRNRACILRRDEFMTVHDRKTNRPQSHSNGRAGTRRCRERKNGEYETAVFD